MYLTTTSLKSNLMTSIGLNPSDLDLSFTGFIISLENQRRLKPIWLKEFHAELVAWYASFISCIRVSQPFWPLPHFKQVMETILNQSKNNQYTIAYCKPNTNLSMSELKYKLKVLYYTFLHTCLSNDNYKLPLTFRKYPRTTKADFAYLMSSYLADFFHNFQPSIINMFSVINN